MPLRAARAAAIAILLLASQASAAIPRGPAALAEAKRLHAEVTALTEKARYADALPLADRALAIREKELGPKHPDVAESLFDLAEVLAHRADYARAEPLHRRALAIREAALGKDHLDVAMSLAYLGTLLTNTGRFAEAEPMFARTLAIREKKLPKADRLIASAESDLGSLYYFQGEYVKAQPMLERALSATEAALGKDHPETALVASNLAALFDKLGRFADAEPLHRRALAIREKALGPDHPDVATSLSNLGVAVLGRGDAVEAVALQQRALAIREKALGPDHPSTGESLNNVAAAYDALGDPDRAVPLYERALGILEKTLGPGHPTTVGILQNLAIILVTHDDPRGKSYAERLFAARSKQIERGDPEAVEAMLAMANLKGRLGIVTDARTVAERALAIVEQHLGPDHPLAAEANAVIGAAYAGNKDLEHAEARFRRAVEIAEKGYGPNHPRLAQILLQLASVTAKRGDGGRAIDLAARAAEIDERALRIVLGTGSDARKRQRAEVFMIDAERIIAIHADRAASDPRATRLALLAVLRRKGRSIDAAADGVGALRRRLAPDDAAILDRLAEVRGAIAAHQLAAPGTAASFARIDDLDREAGDLEAKISQKSAEIRGAEAPITVEAVQARIPEGAALVEIYLRLLYDRDGRPTYRYLAYVLGHAGDPSFVDLGEAQPINDSVAALRDAISTPASADVRARARALDERVMRPIRRLLGGAKQILFAPDGQLALVPLNALVDEADRYLIESYSITYLTSGRDLLRQAIPSPAADPALVIANPDFGEDAGAKLTAVPRDRGLEDLARAFFPPLPGTAEEAKAIARAIPDARVLTRGEATEDALKAAHRPRILHIATHGFFLGHDTAAGGPRERAVDDLMPPLREDAPTDPLLLSGIALAGANRQGGARPGIVTALEASALDLWGTKLVVLSACETGLGAVESGVGVSGLRRALVLAGAESAVMSLWKVDDAATRGLMTSMYERLARGGGRTESLREAEIETMRRKGLEHPYFWASFIPLGDYRSLSGEVTTPRFEAPAGRLPPGARCGCEMPGERARPGWEVVGIGAVVAAMGRRRRGRQGR